jgi:AraC-like DNA-binding protein
MARYDPHNRAKYWSSSEIGGISLLRAAFATLSYAPHMHDELVVAVTEDGAGRFISGGQCDYASPRAVVVFNPGVPHEGGVFDARGWHYRAIYIGAEALERICENVFERPGLTPHFARNTIDDAALAGLILAAHRTLETSTARLAKESVFLTGLARLLERHAEPRPHHRDLGYEKGPMNRVVDVMNERLAEDLSVVELAAIAGMSAFHFIRAFRKEIGLPPHAYLTQLRLREARRLLREGSELADAAVAAGFYDQSHLTKHFKRTYGITPAQYAIAASRITRMLRSTS